MKLKEKPKSLSQELGHSTSISSVTSVAAKTLAFSLLNPHVYLDTVVLIGGYSSKFSDLLNRFLFGFGAAAASVMWFLGLVMVSVGLSRFLNNAKTMRLISVLSGMILLSLAFKLGMDVLKWHQQGI